MRGRLVNRLVTCRPMLIGSILFDTVPGGLRRLPTCPTVLQIREGSYQRTLGRGVQRIVCHSNLSCRDWQLGFAENLFEAIAEAFRQSCAAAQYDGQIAPGLGQAAGVGKR